MQEILLIGVMLGQRHDKIFHSIYHAKRTPMKLNSTTPPLKRIVSCDIRLSQSLDRT
jgi:hypothetical protein